MELLTWLVNAIVALALAGSAGGRDDFHWSGRIAPGQVIEIKGVSGSVAATAASGSEVEVVARKHAKRSDPAGVEIRVVPHEAGVTICAVYPSAEGRPNECRPGEGGHMNTRDNDVSVEFEVRVPTGVRFAGRTVNGSVRAEGLGADVEAVTVNGEVRIATEGRAQAETVNGSITARLGSADGSEPLDFKTVNGSIRVELPASASANVRAETVNGEISTDLPVSVQGRLSRHTLSGTLGGGGRELRLTTVNGGIELRQGR